MTKRSESKFEYVWLQWSVAVVGRIVCDPWASLKLLNCASIIATQATVRVRRCEPRGFGVVQGPLHTTMFVTKNHKYINRNSRLRYLQFSHHYQQVKYMSHVCIREELEFWGIFVSLTWSLHDFYNILREGWIWQQQFIGGMVNFNRVSSLSFAIHVWLMIVVKEIGAFGWSSVCRFRSGRFIIHYSLLIIDDEHWIIKSLVHFINFRTFGFRIFKNVYIKWKYYY